MKLLRNFLQLPVADKWLLVKTALLLEAIKLTMRLLPFRVLRSLAARAAGVVSTSKLQRANYVSVDRVAWAVEVASRHTPGVKSCLNQALAAQVLLGRHGHPALVHIGVARGERGRFQAHAWVESGGKVVIGGSGRERFTPLVVLEGERLSGGGQDRKL
jgi:Transglutaminase-like superfamily